MSDLDIRLGVDIGGTFTDLVLETPQGMSSTKVLTTYGAPEDAILDGMHQVCAKAGIDPSAIKQVIHGTTLATNALIERRGAKTALITTKGFRDVIEMRTESRFEQYDLNLKLPDPLLPRQYRYPISERLDADGNVLIALDETELSALVQAIKTAGFESVAIGTLHSYVNDAHEQRIAEALRAAMPELSISLSSEVSPQMREYERFNTTIANAYIKPLMASYLGRLKQRLAEEGADCPVFLMHSGGGIISLESAAEFPVRLVESGPAGGAVFAAKIAEAHGLDKVLSFDMGGTTAKICLIKNQTPKTARVFEVARSYRFKKGSGMPISIPVIDMVEIGAGGGSLAHVDALNQIRVGPKSAGSEPGPACYGRGGQQPAVTDADLVLGKLDPDNFAGGSFKLSAHASGQALETELGAKLGMSRLEAAQGLVEVVDENMSNAARVHAVENGEDLSDYTMIAFGGAAPLHAARLCEKLGIDRCLVPPGAGVGSAIGFLRAPFSFEATKSVVMSLDRFDEARVGDTLASLRTEASDFVRLCDNGAEILTSHKVYMRYRGQGWEIPIDLPQELIEAPEAAALKALFEAEYTSLFGRPVAGLEIEAVVWAVNTFTQQAKAERVAAADTGTFQGIQGQRPLFDLATESLDQATEIQRADLKPGQVFEGPAVVVEDETTIIVPTSRSAKAWADGTIDVFAKR